MRRRWLAGLDTFGHCLEFFKQWQVAPANGIPKPFTVSVAGSDNRDGQKILQNSGNMEGAVAFPRSYINVHPIQVHVHGIEHHRTQDGAINLGKMGLPIHGQRKLRFVKINNSSLFLIDLTDNLQRRYTDYADYFFSSGILPKQQEKAQKTHSDMDGDRRCKGRDVAGFGKRLQGSP